MWWMLGFRAGAAEVTPGSSRGVVAEVLEGGGLLQRGVVGLDAVAPPAAELLVPTSSAAVVVSAAKASGNSTDWIRRLNMFLFAGFFLSSPGFSSEYIPH